MRSGQVPIRHARIGPRSRTIPGPDKWLHEQRVGRDLPWVHPQRRADHEPPGRRGLDLPHVKEVAHPWPRLGYGGPSRVHLLGHLARQHRDLRLCRVLHRRQALVQWRLQISRQGTGSSDPAARETAPGHANKKSGEGARLSGPVGCASGRGLANGQGLGVLGENLGRVRGGEPGLLQAADPGAEPQGRAGGGMGQSTARALTSRRCLLHLWCGGSRFEPPTTGRR